MATALARESRNVQWPIAGAEKVRLQPVVAAILDEARRAGEGKGEQLVKSAWKLVLIEDILSEHLHRVYSRVGKLLGLDFPNGKPIPRWEVCCPNCGLHFLTQAQDAPR